MGRIFASASEVLHVDDDGGHARVWAAMAIGGVGGFVAGRIAPLRRFKTRRKLQTFVEEHPR